MPPSAGDKLGPYELLALIGEGGMGSVYKARDTRLDRTVAIKVSREEFSERFESEARAVAALNHVNVCTLHDIGANYIVMEFVDGPTLAERMSKGAMTLDEALPIARQMADAIEAAHEKGIIHRDLKPENVKLTTEGVVKVLDFGLAKAAEALRDPGSAPTIRASASVAGMIVGTPEYMSPEQASGKPVDKRSDIWSYGVILWEMLTGRRLFEGETISHTLAAVLTQQPRIGDAPARVRPLLSRCLVQDPKLRMRDIGEARLMLAAPLGSPVPNASASSAVPRTKVPMIAAAAFAMVAIVTTVLWWRASRPVVQPLLQFAEQISLPGSVGHSKVAVSPDGMRLVFANPDSVGSGRLVTRRLDQAKQSEIEGTEGADSPFFSPDGRWIGFVNGNKVRKISVEGGPAITLCETSLLRGASWGNDGYIVLALANNGVLSRIPAAGGTPQPVTALQGKEQTHRFPQVLEGGKTVLFAAGTLGDHDDDEIVVQSVPLGVRKTIHRGGTFPRYLPSGHIVFMKGGTMFAMPFNLGRREAGLPVPVIEKISYRSISGLAQLDLSTEGTVVYRESEFDVLRTVQWLDRTGKLAPILVKPARYSGIRVAPDGNRIAIAIGDPASTDIWVHDSTSGALTRLTFSESSSWPVWSPDGRLIAYYSRDGVYMVPSDGNGKPRRLTEAGAMFPTSFSPDGRNLVLRSTGAGVSILPIDENPERRTALPLSLLLPGNQYGTAVISPDGKWLAYSSIESGQAQVFVTSFPDKSGRWQITTGSGTWPEWSRTGSQLFFHATDGRLMVVSYSIQNGAFTFGIPEVWNERQLEAPSMVSPLLASLAPDGKRFAVLMDDGKNKPVSRVIVLRNFFGELKRRLAIGGAE